MNEPLTPENTVLTDEQFKEHVKNHREAAQDSINGDDDHFIPRLTVIIRKEDGTEELVVCVLNLPLNEVEEKQQALFMCGEKFYNEQKIVIGIVFSSEAWMSRQDKKEYKEKPVMPRDDPNKVEVVIVAGSGLKAGQKHMVSIPIWRDGKDKMWIDEAIEPIDSGEVALPMLEWFWKGFFLKVMEAQQ